MGPKVRWRPQGPGKKTPEVIKAIEEIMKYDTAGDPITGLKWTRRTTGKISEELKKQGIQVGRETVARLLKSMNFSLRVNHKKISSASNPDRDEQFEHIASLREEFASSGDPVVSVDSKKKEMIGRFKNRGRTWTREPVLVNDHDFRSMAKGMAIPYGVYDVRDNSAAVVVGVSYETPQFAVACVGKWWIYQGRTRYAKARRLLILADNGGGNGATPHAWKYFLQWDVCNKFGVSVTVAHYPPGCSKWNPIEHRVFSQISENWQGRPLDSYETCLNYISTTKTSTGLTTKAYLDKKQYEKGIEISKEEMALLSLEREETLPKWNYTLRPQ
jgi:hypothetical protein